MSELEPVPLSPRELLLTHYNSSYPNLMRLEVDSLADEPFDIHQETINRLALRGNETVLDVGCNDGRVLAQLKLAGHKGILIGVDPAQEALDAGDMIFGERARQRVFGDEDRLIQGFAEDLPLPTNSVDRVIAARLFDNLEDVEESVEDALREMMRVTRLGGIIGITTSGEANKRGTHQLSGRIDKHLKVRGRTALTNGFTSEIAEPFFREFFPELEVQHYISPIRLRAGDDGASHRQVVHRTGHETYHALRMYRPKGSPHLVPVSLKDWQEAYDKTAKPVIEKAIEEKGEWRDLVHRTVFIAKNPEITRRPVQADEINELVLCDQHRTLTPEYDIFEIFNAMADDGFITAAGNRRIQAVYERMSDKVIEFDQFVIDTMYTAADALKGRRVDVAKRIAQLFLEQNDAAWFSYVRPMLDEVKRRDGKAALITAAPQFMADTTAKVLGFDYAYGSRFGLNYRQGTFTGTVLRIMNGSKKAEIAKKLTGRAKHSIGFGDSTGDLGMLMQVDKPFVVNPTDELRHFAEEADWQIIEDPNQPVSFQEMFEDKA